MTANPPSQPESETPESDSAEIIVWQECGNTMTRRVVVPADISCRLEKERDQLRAELDAANARIELLEHDAKSGDYESLYAATVVELDAAKADAARLDWIRQNVRRHDLQMNSTQVFLWPRTLPRAITFNEAIDAAMQTAAAKKEE